MTAAARPSLRLRAELGRPTLPQTPPMQPPALPTLRPTSRARAKSVLRGLTCGYGGQRPKSGLLSPRCALYLHGEHSAHVQVGATRRSVCRSAGPESAADRRLSTPASEQVNRLSDDFARACGNPSTACARRPASRSHDLMAARGSRSDKT